MPSYPVLGELIRIGDIILQERSNYESRKLVNVVNPTTAAMTILKGQVLAGNAVMATFPAYTSNVNYMIGAVVNYSGANYVCTVNNTTQTPGSGTAWALLSAAKSGVVYPLADNPLGQSTTVTITLAATPTGGTFQIGYGSLGYGAYSLGQEITGALAYNAAAATIVAALQQLSPDLAGVTATWTTAAILTLTIPASAMPQDGLLPFTVYPASLTGAGANGIPVIVVQEGVLPQQPASCVSLQQVTVAAGQSAQLLVVVREAMLKPGYLTYVPVQNTNVLASGLTQVAFTEAASAATIALANQQLEYYQLMVVLTQPSFGTAQDVDLNERVMTPTQGIVGL